jgi:hypothetical protein
VRQKLIFQFFWELSPAWIFLCFSHMFVNLKLKMIAACANDEDISEEYIHTAAE